MPNENALYSQASEEITAASQPESFLPKGLSFTESSVRYKDTEILYSDVTSVTFYTLSLSVNFIPVRDLHTIKLCSDTQSIVLKSSKAFKIGNARRKKEFETILTLTQRHIFPQLVQKIVQTVVEDDQTFLCGGIAVDATGLSRRGFFGGLKTLPWSNYYNCGLFLGEAKVYQKAASRKKYSTWGSVSLAKENAILLPYVVNTVFQQCHHRPPPIPS